MVNISNLSFWISLAGLLFLGLRDLRRSGNIGRCLLFFAVLSVVGAAYYAFFQSASQIRPKRDQSHELAFVVVLYVFMLLGMASNYLYSRFVAPKAIRPPFDLGNFIAPMIASPIIFIPLLGAFQNTYVDLANLTVPKMMIFLVTFENGFFWKEIFDNRRKEQQH